MEVIIGNGNYEVVPIDLDGRKGLLFQLLDEQHEVGEITGSTGEKRQVKDSDVVIWFENIEGARVVQDAINMSVLNMLGLKVI